MSVEVAHANSTCFKGNRLTGLPYYSFHQAGTKSKAVTEFQLEENNTFGNERATKWAEVRSLNNSYATNLVHSPLDCYVKEKFQSLHLGSLYYSILADIPSNKLLRLRVSRQEFSSLTYST